MDSIARPVRATVVESGREVFLQWDSAIDDGGHLRRCVACGCPDLFHEKAFPVITSVIVVLAFLGAAVGLLGFADRPVVLAVLSAVLVADIAVFTLSRRHLVCYRCHSAYPGEPIARYHRGWDRGVAERHPRTMPPPPPADRAAGEPNAGLRPRRRATTTADAPPTRGPATRLPVPGSGDRG